MDEFAAISKVRQDSEAAISVERTHPMDNLAVEQILDETFCILVLGLEAMTDHRIETDHAQSVIVVVGDDTKGGGTVE